MIVLHPTQEQYDALNGYTNGVYRLEFVKDGSDRWVVGTNVLTHPAYSAIHNDLDALERIEFTPLPTE